MELFTAEDFEIFEVEGFEQRMQAIRSRIRPKLIGIGDDLLGPVQAIVDRPLYAHVARHARRTVHPPDDTWVALGPDKRGYKKDIHFKVAVSGDCLRLLFEVGPEYYDKAEWAMRWQRDAGSISRMLASNKHLGWFKDEHDEVPAASLTGWNADRLRDLGKELGRRRDGQLVIGRRIDKAALVGRSPAGFKRAALGTFRSLAPLFALHELRRAS